jgi:hypothetical protein
MSKSLKIMIPLVVLIIGVLVIGAIGYILFSRKGGNAEVVFAATEVGKPEGPNVTKNIGPAGGTLASPDGRLTLTVPQNALTETLPFSIQPITNKADGGLGLAYRLGPDGKTFATPLEISFRYDDHDLAGTVPEALTLAYQDGKGAWHAQKSAKLDQAAKALTISTTHFTDFAELAGLRMQPAEVTLYVGQDTCIQLIQCEEPGFWDKLWSRPLHCTATRGDGNWKLRGAGRMDYECARGVRYEAPIKKPNPNIAWVDLSANLLLRDRITGETSTTRKDFSTKITILDRGYRATGSDGEFTYSGTICDLTKPFTVVSQNQGMFTFKFTPSGDGRAGTGTWDGSYGSVYWTGGGPYTIEGFDSENPKIVFVTHETVSPGASGNGTFHIDLIPLDGNECGGG